MTPKKKPKDKPHYVNNKEFSHAVMDYVTKANEAKSKEEEVPVIPEYIGSCFLKMCYGLASKPNFSQYTYKEEMVMDAVENLIKAIMNYKISTETRTGAPNAFGYFTMIAYRAFLRRIAKEKKQQDIKEKFMDLADFSDFVDGDCIGGEGIAQRVRHRNDLVRKRNEDKEDVKFVVKRTRSPRATSNLTDYFA